MKISLNSIRGLNKRYGCADDIAPNGVDDLVEKIGAQLGAVEEVIDFGSKYAEVLVAKVVSCDNHPNADRLHVCKIDDGGRAEHVERDEQGHVQVVCGAPNVHEGMLVAWLPPGATVPESLDKEPFVLEARELRGVVSNGMLASAKELSIGDSHDGILEVDKDVAPGTPFADAYELTGDVIIDIENKMFTHRPDCFGLLGVDRELAGIQDIPFKSPDWYRMDAEIPEPETDELRLELHNEVPELVPRFAAITMRDVQVGPSPVWLQIALAKVGIRSINNIVDYTNFFMLETGQPLHAYDYDKVKAQDEGADHATIVVRNPKPSEKITLLNGKEITPRSEAIMIATAQKVIGVGGVMGGTDTEVDENTKNIILECANFDMYSIRRTSMAHGLFTDAVTRFNKGQSPLQNRAVLAKIVDEIRRFAGGKVASGLIDDNHLPAEVLTRGSLHPPVKITREFINARLGLQLENEAIKTLLENVEFMVESNDEALVITTPFWRTDVETREDVVEEVGRLYGFDHLPLGLPQRTITPTKKDDSLELKSKIRSALAKSGANEVLTYSFVHGNLFEKVGQDREQAFQLSNALSPDLQYFRLSLTPSLLEKVHANIKAGHNEFAIFELGKIHNKTQHEEDGLPREFNALSFVFAADDKWAQQAYAGAAYYEARKYLMNLLAACNAHDVVTFEPLTDEQQSPWITQITAPFEPGRSAVLRDAKGRVWGIVGEFKASVRKALKLPAFAAGFEAGPLLFTQGHPQKQYAALPRFPKVEQDICLKVSADMTYQDLYKFVWEKLGEVQPPNTLPSLGPVDIYQRDDDKHHKQITLRFTIASYERTMNDAEVNKMLDHVAEAAHEQFKAERI